MAKEDVVSNRDSAGHQIEQCVLQVRTSSNLKPICWPEEMRFAVLRQCLSDTTDED
jgi:hypothetical protein